MEREDIYNFIVRCGPCMKEQLQKEVADFLFENKIINRYEYDEIQSYNKREHQIERILDLLPSKGKENFNVFLQYVSQWYSWIIEKCKISHENWNAESVDIDKVLEEGEVPPPPSPCVNRKDEFARLTNRLRSLKRNEYVVVHGMRGCGKTTIITDVLRRSRSLVIDAFKNRVFWLTVGRATPADQLALLQELCAKVASHHGYSVPVIPMDSQSVQDFLRKRFRNEELEDCLLVLDDVSADYIISSLDIGCKILITTDDKTVMNKTSKKVYYEKVSDGFTEAETLLLFSDKIECKSEELPPQAKHIHTICKGFPLTISLVSSQLAEHREIVLRSSNRWDSYVSKLKEKDIHAAIGRFDQYRLEQVLSLYKAIGLSIDSLNATFREYYQDFALFMDDVNIKPEVLCILWDLDLKSVEDIMMEFERKCLAIRAYNHTKNSYIYCVHDLLLDYLKRQLTSLERQALHRKLINAYQNRYGADLNNFPVDDNYIFLYLGYHLKEANLLDQFPRLYLNLRFIEKKIVNNGAADLLSDFDKYKTFIIQEGDNKAVERYDDFVRFIKKVGACKSISNCDIIQFALCESKQSFVYEAALNIIKNASTQQNSCRTYFELLVDIPEETARFTSAPYYTKEEIEVAVFVCDVNIIVANSLGNIKLMNIPNNLYTLMTFTGHEDRVTHLQVNKNMCYFLSTSEDTTIRVWDLNNFSAFDKHYFEKPRTPSPQLKQEEYVDVWKNQRPSGEAAVAVLDQHYLPVKCAQFSNDGMMIVSCAGEFEIIVWKFVFQKEKNSLTLHNSEVIRTKEPIYHCGFSNCDDLILCAAEKGAIYVYECISYKPITVTLASNEIISMLVVPDMDNVAALVLGKAYCYVVYPMKGPSATNIVFERSNESQFLESRKEKCRVILGSVSWDGKYVAVAMNNFVIFVYDITTGQEVAKLNGNNDGIRDLSWSRQTYSLLAVYRNRILKIWNLTNNKLSKNHDEVAAFVKLLPNILDTFWVADKNKEDYPNDRSSVQVFSNLQLYDKFNRIRICSVFKRIIYSCLNGSVFSIPKDQWISCSLTSQFLHRGVLSFDVFCDTNNNRSLIVLLTNTAPSKFSLIGLMRYLFIDKEEEKEITYVKDSNGIRKFDVNWKTNSLYLIENDHCLKICDVDSGVVKRSYDTCGIEYSKMVELCDVSPDFSQIAVSDSDVLYVRSMITGRIKHKWRLENKNPVTCKFAGENILVVGFKDGLLQIFEVERGMKRFSFPSKTSDLSSFKLISGSVISIIPSSTSVCRILVIYEREIVLFDIAEEIKVISVLWINVDKVLYDPTFTKLVTLDSCGLLKIFKHPIFV